MTTTEYFIYSRLFDAVVAANAIDGSTGIQLHGQVVGEALRRWATHNGMNIKEDCRSVDSIGDWTALVMDLPNGMYQTITVHLDTKPSADVATRAS